MKVLIVDDNEQNLYLLRALLEGHDCTVDDARHGAEALTKARQDPPRLVISDLLMPVMDGYTLLRHWKADDRLKAIPFVVYTATYTEPKDERLALDLGADAFIVKPAEPEPFMARIREVLAKTEADGRPFARMPQGAETVLLREYGETVVRKLEKKALQLEQANRALQEDVARREEAEARANRLLAEAERARAALLAVLEEQRKAEVALRENEERLRLALSAANQGFYDLNVQTGETIVSPEYARMLGYEPEEFHETNAAWHDRLHPDDREPVYRVYQEYLAGQHDVYRVEFRQRTKSGDWKWILSLGRLVARDAEGKPLRMLGTHTDITERKRAEAALQESEHRYQTLAETSPAGVFRTDHNGQTTYVNARWCELAGLAAAEAMGEGWQQAVHPEDRAALLLGWQEATGIEGVSQAEYRFLRPDGSVTWVLGQATPERDAAGHFIGYVGTITDITERRQAENRIRQQAALLEASHDAILVWDVTAGVQFMNAAAEELTGRAFAQAQSQDLPSVLRTRSDLELRAAIQEVTAHGDWSGDLTLFTADDQPREVASRWTVLTDTHGKPASILITCNDITEKKQLESQYLRAQRLESVGTLASGVAHDLNNILSPIIMGVEMLNLETKDAETRSILAMMQESAHRGADTVKQLLTFARGAESKKGPVQPRHLLKEIARLLQQTLPKNIQIYTDYAGQSAAVLADPSQLHQVLMNLCVNARDAMPDGGVLFVTLQNKTLDASAAKSHPKARPIPYVVFKVSDSGTGIPPEVLERIFDPFFTTKPQGKGTGLGLATVLGIVESHGGFVLVESKLGQGTTFQIFIPASTSAEGVNTSQESEGLPCGQGELVLVVDDEAAILRMAENVLRRNGYVPLTASNASEALHLYEKNHDRIQAVITDLMMPFGDGRQLITLLYEQDPKLPIIAMSGLASMEFQRETLRRGARAFVSKPFTSEQLLTVLSDVLKPSLG